MKELRISTIDKAIDETESPRSLTIDNYLRIQLLATDWPNDLLTSSDCNSLKVHSYCFKDKISANVNNCTFSIDFVILIVCEKIRLKVAHILSNFLKLVLKLETFHMFDCEILVRY